jgi:hypothetical protein
MGDDEQHEHEEQANQCAPKFENMERKFLDFLLQLFDECRGFCNLTTYGGRTR